MSILIFVDSDSLVIGDIKDLSPNANVMLRISTLAAWAELQVASSHQTYLTKIVEPHRSTLATLWIASLKDYAGIKGDSEVLQESTSASMDSPTSGMGREVLLPVCHPYSLLVDLPTDAPPVLRRVVVENPQSNRQLDVTRRWVHPSCDGWGSDNDHSASHQLAVARRTHGVLLHGIRARFRNPHLHGGLGFII